MVVLRQDGAFGKPRAAAAAAGVFTNVFVFGFFPPHAGYSYVNDESGLLMGHMTLWSFSDIKRIIRCLQVRLSARDTMPPSTATTTVMNVFVRRVPLR